METDSKDKITSVEQLIAWADTRCHGHLAYTSTDLTISTTVWAAYANGGGGVFLLNEPLSSGIRGARKAAFDVSRPNGWNYQIDRNSHLWWFYREMLRHYVGDRIMPGSVFMNWLYGAPAWHFPFMAASGNDADISFYYTFEDGLRDKVTTMNVGRYITKFIPWTLDCNVQALESMYRAEASNEIEIFMGGEEINHYYMHGPGSCMSKNWKHDYGANPLMTYDAPGWGIAVLRPDKKKRYASARSLVWINPQDENEKHFIRVYGDYTLHRRLLRNKFQNRVPNMAPLKYVEKGAQFFLPYFDSTNNNGAGDGGILFFDKERPYMISPAKKAEMSGDSRLSSVYTVRSTSIIYNVNSYTRYSPPRCLHCGVNSTAGVQPGWLQVHHGRETESVCPACAKEQEYRVALDYRGRKTLKPACQTVAVRGLATPWAVDDKRTLNSLGLAPLDPLLYTDRELMKGGVPSPKNSAVVWHLDDVVTVARAAKNTEGFELDVRNRRSNDYPGEEDLVRLVTRADKALLYADKTLESRLKVTPSNQRILPALHKDHIRLAREGDVWGSSKTYTQLNLFNTRRGLQLDGWGNYWAKLLAAGVTLEPEEVQAAVKGLAPGDGDFFDAMLRSRTHVSTWLVPHSQREYRGHINTGGEVGSALGNSVSALRDLMKADTESKIEKFTVYNRDALSTRAHIKLREIYLQLQAAYGELRPAVTQTAAEEAIAA